jgi:hypothetical protein
VPDDGRSVMGLRFSSKDRPNGVVSPTAGWQDNVGGPPAQEIECAENQNVIIARFCGEILWNNSGNFLENRLFGRFWAGKKAGKAEIWMPAVLFIALACQERWKQWQHSEYSRFAGVNTQQWFGQVTATSQFRFSVQARK